jgi:hypothetical protein
MSKALPRPTPAQALKALISCGAMYAGAFHIKDSEAFNANMARLPEIEASHTQLVQALQTALPALWKLSMRRHVRLGHGGTEVPNGTSCQLCEIQANEGVELNHLENCPISIVRSALRASTLSTDTDKQKGTL